MVIRLAQFSFPFLVLSQNYPPPPPPGQQTLTVHCPTPTSGGRFIKCILTVTHEPYFIGQAIGVGEGARVGEIEDAAGEGPQVKGDGTAFLKVSISPATQGLRSGVHANPMGLNAASSWGMEWGAGEPGVFSFIAYPTIMPSINGTA